MNEKHIFIYVVKRFKQFKPFIYFRVSFAFAMSSEWHQKVAYQCFLFVFFLFSVPSIAFGIVLVVIFHLPLFGYILFIVGILGLVNGMIVFILKRKVIMNGIYTRRAGGVFNPRLNCDSIDVQMPPMPPVMPSDPNAAPAPLQRIEIPPPYSLNPGGPEEQVPRFFGEPESAFILSGLPISTSNDGDRTSASQKHGYVMRC